MDPSSLNEWLQIVTNLPNHKATGPSLISYEMIKKSSLTMHEVLLKTITKSMELTNIFST